MNIVYLNGQFLAAEEAKVSVFDRGFLFGDSVYEVIPFYQGQGFRLQAHLERLQHSLSAVQIDAVADWAGILEALVDQNGGGNLSVYLQVSRGDSGERSHGYTADLQPTIFACCKPIRDLYHAGPDSVTPLRARVIEDLRGRRCDIKSTSLQPAILGLQQVKALGADEALQMRDGVLTEGTSSNLFVIQDNVINTPLLGHEILGGVTRQLVLELAVHHGIEVCETDLTYQQLINADEVWISSSTRAVVPIIDVDGQAIANGQPGPLWRQMYQLFIEFHHALMTGQKNV